MGYMEIFICIRAEEVDMTCRWRKRQAMSRTGDMERYKGTLSIDNVPSVVGVFIGYLCT